MDDTFDRRTVVGEDRRRRWGCGNAGDLGRLLGKIAEFNRPGVTAPIIGASKLAHLEDALRASEIQLSAEEMQYLEECYEPHPVLGHS